MATRALSQQLTSWLLNAAYPLWSANGRDAEGGGFHERLDAQGHALDEPRRARVQPRQLYSLAMAASLGWQRDVARIVTEGVNYYRKAYRRDDGLYRALVKPNGEIVDDSAVLYDQAFTLLGFAAAKHLVTSIDLEDEATKLRAIVYREFKRERGFRTAAPASHSLNAALQSNPHMHLLEASLAWSQVSSDPEWRRLADEIATLAMQCFIDPATGALKEFFDDQWRPVQGIQGRIVEPGHQFEWAWLLLRWGGNQENVRRAALTLIDIGERHGVKDGVAINSLLDDFSAHDNGARLWPQTERIKAAAIAARLTGDARYWKMTNEAIKGLLLYLDTPLPGLWFDKRSPNGKLTAEPAPASTFYHIVAAVAELQLLTKM